MINSFRIALALFFIIFISGCTTTVDLTVENGTESPITLTVVLKDANGAKSNNDLQLGVLGVNEESKISFKLKPKSSFEVIGSTNAKVASSGTITVLEKPDPLYKKITLAINEEKMIDDSASFNEISNLFKRIGVDDIGACPLPLSSALKTTIGSLIVAERGSENNPGKKYLTIHPNVFGIKELTLEDVPRIPQKK